MFIKQIARALLEKYGDKFTTDFNKNRQIIEQIAYISSKKIRNQVAGYITKLMSKSPS